MTAILAAADGREKMAETVMIDHSKDNLLRIAEVRRRTSLGRTTIYRKIGEGTFPRPVRISAGLTAWYESEIDMWVSNPLGWRSAA